MKRTVSFLVFVALLVLAGCSNSGAVAATVNGHDISSEDVVRGAHAFGQSALFRQQLSQQGVDLRPTGTVPTSFAAQWLVSLVQTEAIEQYAAKKHVTASDQEVAQARQQFTAQGSQSAAAFEQLPKWLQNQLINTTALQIAVRSTLKPSVSDAKLAAAYAQLSSDCASKRLIGHILVPTADAAQQVVDRIKGGESFATVAAAVSTDGSSAQGGLLGCEGNAQWAQVDPTFRAAAEAVPAGGISAPVQTQFGFHVIEALPLTPENARPLVLASLQAADPLEPVIGRFVKQAKITVNPRFGKLQRSGTSFTIVPPTPKKVRSLPSATPSTTRPAATGGTGSSSGTSSTTATSSP